MKRRAAVVLFAVSVAGAVWLWPAWPAWSVRSAGKVVGFTADGNRLIRAEQVGSAVRLVNHDAASGRAISTTILAGVDGGQRLVPSPDGRTVVAVRSTCGPEGPAGCSIHDAATGAVVTPFAAAPLGTTMVEFSCRGRWRVHGHRTVALLSDGEQRWEVVEAATGRVALAVRSTEVEACVAVAVRDDETAAAVVWASRNEDRVARSLGTNRGSVPTARVEVYDLSESRVTRRFAVTPADFRLEVADWRGDRMLLMEWTFGTADTYREFDTAAEPVGPGVVRADLAGAGLSASDFASDGYIRQERRGVVNGFPEDWVQWGANRGWWEPPTIIESQLRFRYLDPATGATHGGPTRWFSADATPVADRTGRWVATADARTVAVWPTRPGPRGPFAMLAAGVVLLLGRRVTR